MSDITYEELIRSENWQFHFWYSLSDITYEELIRFKKLNSGISWIKCRTLPMRNWYLYAMTYVYSLTFHANVGHYLWGIDTFFALFHFNIAFCYLVGHYLWGIDTFRAHKRYCKYIYMHESRTLPMRNWHVYGIRTFQFVLSSGITFPTRIPCANT